MDVRKLLEILIVIFHCESVIATSKKPKVFNILSQNVEAYDCQNPDSKLWTLDVTKVDNCMKPNEMDQPTTLTVQIISQVNALTQTFQSCHVSKYRVAYHCGMHSHTSGLEILDWGPEEVTVDMCKEMTKKRIFKPSAGDSQIYDLKDSVNRFQVFRRGWLDNGKCHEPGSWIQNGKVYTGFIIADYYTIKLEEFSGTLVKGRYKLPNSKITVSSRGFDEDLGTYFSDSEKKCLDDYEELYYGVSVGPKEPQFDSVIVTANNDTQKYGATKLQKLTAICGEFSVFETPYSGIYYRFVDSYSERLDINPISPLNVRLNSAIGMLASFVHEDVMQKLKLAYEDTLQRSCEQTRSWALNALALINNEPSNAYLVFGQGFLAKPKGAVIEVAQCSLAEEVKMRKTTACYEDLPIWHQGAQKFRDPLTFIILDVSPLCDCKLDYRVHHIGNFYVAQKPELTFENATIKQMSPYDYHSNGKSVIRHAFVTLGSLAGSTLDNAFVALMFAHSKRTVMRRYNGELVVGMGYSKDKNMVEASMGMFDKLNSAFQTMIDAFYRYSGVVSLSIFLVGVMIVLFIWILAVLRSICKHGVRSGATATVILSILFLLWDILMVVARYTGLINKEPKSRQKCCHDMEKGLCMTTKKKDQSRSKKDQSESKEDLNTDELWVEMESHL